MGDIIIRNMEERDIEQVVAIENSIFSLPWSYNSFLGACSTRENIYLVCEKDNKVMGYCGLWTVMGEGNITNMAVDSDYRRLGYAEKLMIRMEEEGLKKDVNTFFLEVRESNTGARKLYSKMQYIEIGQRKRFYERPVENAIVMSKMYRINRKDSV